MGKNDFFIRPFALSTRSVNRHSNTRVPERVQLATSTMYDTVRSVKKKCGLGDQLRNDTSYTYFYLSYLGRRPFSDKKLLSFLNANVLATQSEYTFCLVFSVRFPINVWYAAYVTVRHDDVLYASTAARHTKPPFSSSFSTITVNQRVVEIRARAGRRCSAADGPGRRRGCAHDVIRVYRFRRSSVNLAFGPRSPGPVPFRGYDVNYLSSRQ